MKKIFLCLFGFLFFIACNKVPHPIVPKTTVIGSNFIKNSNASVSSSKKTLLEEYTGQRCPNCPDGASIIKYSLLPQYPKNLIVIAVHQGNTFAAPTKEFTNDFRTSAGDAWGSDAGFSVDSWPSGIINRTNYNGTGMKLNRTKWTSVVPTSFNDRFIIKLDLSTEYDTAVRALNVFVKGTFITSHPNPIKLCVVYTEDGLIGKQDDQGEIIEDYEFEHMLRGDINGTWGENLTTASAAKKDTVRWSRIGFQLPLTGGSNNKGLNINDNNVSVVVFVYDEKTKEVLQAEKVKIRGSEGE